MPTHSETRVLPYSAQQMYDLVAEVDRYPEFIPWTAASRVRSRRPSGRAVIMDADLVISFKVFRERFGSRVTLWPEDKRIDTEYLDGPFKHMISKWGFADLSPEAIADRMPEGVTRACEVSFFVDFEFKNRLLQGAAGMFFNEAMHRIVRAFELRAKALYGEQRV